MPQLSEIEFRPNCIRLSDLPSSLIAFLKRRAEETKTSVGDDVLGMIAGHFGKPHEQLTTDSAIVLDPE
jgi:hypothetical protein